jgi:anti-anti-sigma regulatory factor
VIALEGELDPGMMIALQPKINGALNGRRGRVVIDLGPVTDVGAQTLSLFGSALRRLNRSTALAIVGANPGVPSVLERCAIDGFALYLTVNATLAARDDRPVPAWWPNGGDADAGRPGQAQVDGPARGLARPRGRLAAGADRELVPDRHPHPVLRMRNTR